MKHGVLGCRHTPLCVRPAHRTAPPPNPHRCRAPSRGAGLAAAAVRTCRAAQRRLLCAGAQDRSNWASCSPGRARMLWFSYNVTFQATAEPAINPTAMADIIMIVELRTILIQTSYRLKFNGTSASVACKGCVVCARGRALRRDADTSSNTTSLVAHTRACHGAGRYVQIPSYDSQGRNVMEPRVNRFSEV